MMRETIYQALWQRLDGLTLFKTRSRRLKHWSDVDKRAQPALFMAQVSEIAKKVAKTPTQWTFNVDLYLYVSVDDKASPGEAINPLLDAVCHAVQAKPVLATGNTLGLPCVMDCYVDGKIETDEGALGNQAIAIVPVVILAYFE